MFAPKSAVRSIFHRGQSSIQPATRASRACKSATLSTDHPRSGGFLPCLPCLLWSTSVLSSEHPDAFVRLTRLGMLVSQLAAMLCHDNGDGFDSVSHHQDLLLIRRLLWMAETRFCSDPESWSDTYLHYAVQPTIAQCRRLKDRDDRPYFDSKSNLTVFKLS